MSDEIAKAKKRTDDSNEKSKILSEWKDGWFKGHYENYESCVHRTKSAMKRVESVVDNIVQRMIDMKRGK